MPDIRIALTDKAVSNLPLAVEGQYLARDTDLRGFFVLVGKAKKTYTIQGDLRRDGLPQSVPRRTISYKTAARFRSIRLP